MADPAIQPLVTTNAQTLPSVLPTILSGAVATALSFTPQSPMIVQAPQPLAVGPVQYVQAPKSKLPKILGISGIAAGALLLGYLVLRKKRRK